eukprot:6184815-Pleurochrysis_carterae.AAC.2
MMSRPAPPSYVRNYPRWAQASEDSPPSDNFPSMRWAACIPRAEMRFASLGLAASGSASTPCSLCSAPPRQCEPHRLAACQTSSSG